MTHDRTVQSNRNPYPIILIERQVEKEVITVHTPSPTSSSPISSIISDPPSTPIIISDPPSTPIIISDPPSTPIIISDSPSTTHSHQENEYSVSRRMVEEFMARHRERMAKKRKKRKNPFL